MARRQPEKAVSKLEARLQLAPGNFPLTMAYADALMADGKPHVAEPVLVAQSKLNPNDPGLWYLLAEIQGLSGNIVGLHQSRAEYFILNGNLDQAEKQLTYALKLTRGDFLNSATGMRVPIEYFWRAARCRCAWRARRCAHHRSILPCGF